MNRKALRFEKKESKQRKLEKMAKKEAEEYVKPKALKKIKE